MRVQRWVRTVARRDEGVCTIFVYKLYVVTTKLKRGNGVNIRCVISLLGDQRDTGDEGYKWKAKSLNTISTAKKYIQKWQKFFCCAFIAQKFPKKRTSSPFSQTKHHRCPIAAQNSFTPSYSARSARRKSPGRAFRWRPRRCWSGCPRLPPPVKTRQCGSAQSGLPPRFNNFQDSAGRGVVLGVSVSEKKLHTVFWKTDTLEHSAGFFWHYLHRSLIYFFTGCIGCNYKARAAWKR